MMRQLVGQSNVWRGEAGGQGALVSHSPDPTGVWKGGPACVCPPLHPKVCARATW